MSWTSAGHPFVIAPIKLNKLTTPKHGLITMSTAELCHVETTSFHQSLGSKPFPVEAGRYWLFTAKICPFAHRTEIVRVLKGLESDIGITIAGSIQTEKGWPLAKRYQGHGSAKTPISDTNFLPDIYQIASPGFTGRASVPVLFDTVSHQIVNNESAEIIQQLDSNYDTETTLYPLNKRDEIKQFANWLSEELIGPIYHAGFSLTQTTHNEASNRVFNALAVLENHLAHGRRYVIGDSITVADVHSYPHLCRFDSVYHSLYRLNRHFLSDYPAISEYMERLGSIPAFSDTFDLEAMKEGYFLSWNQPTNGQFIPQGPPVDTVTGLAKKATPELLNNVENTQWRR